MNESDEKKLEWDKPSLNVIKIKEETLGGTIEGGSDLGIFTS